MLDRLGIAVHVGRQPRRRLDGSARRAALGRPLAPRSPAGSGRAGPTSRSPTARSTSPSVSALCRIPSAQMQDYEFAGPAAPDRLRRARSGCSSRTRSRSSGCEVGGARSGKLVRYPGLKEEYYLADFEPDPRPSLDELGLDRETGPGRRPAAAGDLRLPRPQRPLRARDRSGVCAGEPTASGGGDPAHRGARAPRRGRSAPPNLIVPERAIDAQSLIAYADLVVSAGGTMNREAVALGTPVYTIFTGRMGGVDEELIADGPAAGPRRPGRASSCASARRPVGVRIRRDPQHPRRRGARGCRGRRLADRAHFRRARAMDPTTTDAVLAFLAAAAIAWLLVPVRRAARLPDRRDRPAEGARPARPPDAAALGPGDLRRDRGRRLDLPALATARPARSCSARSAIAAVGVIDDVFDLPALPKLIGQIGGGDDPGARRRPRRRT